MTLKHKLLAALSGSTSQRPINTATLAVGHRIKAVEAELMGMLERREVMCCKCFKGDNKPVDVWWQVGAAKKIPDSMLKASKRGRITK